VFFGPVAGMSNGNGLEPVEGFRAWIGETGGRSQIASTM